MPRLLAICWFVIAVQVLMASPVRAESDEHPPGWYCSVGGNIGLSFVDSDVAALLGAETSATYHEGTWWYGLFGDVLYDFHRDAFRFGLGPEIGWFVFGVDAGAVMELNGGDATGGMRLRGLVSVALVTLYGGWSHLFAEEDMDIGELGLLIKWPFEL